MADGDPPSIGELQQFKASLEQMKQNVPADANDVLNVNRNAGAKLQDDLASIIGKLASAYGAAEKLYVNSTVVGNFESAKNTADELTKSGDGIKDSLIASRDAVQALHDFVVEALAQLHTQTSNLPG